MNPSLQHAHGWRRLAGTLLVSLLMSLLLAASTTAQPSGTVRGTVVEAGTEMPIERAAVSVRGVSGMAALTDEKGRFQIGIPAGERVLRIRARGYCAEERRVQAAPGRYVRVEVELHPLRKCQDERFRRPARPRNVPSM